MRSCASVFIASFCFMPHPSLCKRKIVHVDMDCFYASVEAKDNPELRGKPVIVGGLSNRSVVCAASYEARKYGVKSAMATAVAKRLCPKGIFLPVRMERYKKESLRIRDIFYRYTDLVQPISLDEAYLDVTRNKKGIEIATRVAAEIKTEIRSETGLTASAGVAPNKLLAKIASDMDKPDGLYVIKPGQVEDFMRELPVRKIWGVGRVTAEKLKRLGIETASELGKADEGMLLEKLGRRGLELRELGRGIDESEVKVPGEPKSIGRETTFEQDLRSLDEVFVRLRAVAEECSRRLRKKDYRGKTITLKIKYSDFSTVTRAESLNVAVNDSETLYLTARSLAENHADVKKGIRLLGISLSHLEDSEMPELFDFFE